MDKEKNPYILIVILHIVTLALFVALVCVNAYREKLVETIVMAIVTAIWGIVTGAFINVAIDFKNNRMTQVILVYMEEAIRNLTNDNIELINKLKEKQNNDGNDIT